VGSLFAGARASLATKHAKLALVAPPLWSTLGMTVISVDVDTDNLGTFSGEIPRPASQLETARRKARLGMEVTGLPLGLASEGSVVDPWGVGAFAVDRELVVLVDDTRHLTIIGRATGTDVIAFATTLDPDEVTDGRVADLVRRADLGRHHVVVCPDGAAPTGPDGAPDPTWLAATTKAVGDAATLRAAVTRAAGVSPVGRARVEPDLRAHLCPSRQRVIAAAAADLAHRLATTCPTCASPGWGTDGAAGNRICSWCGGPTDEPAAVRWACPACGVTEQRPLPPEQPGDPGRCQRCNP